MQPHVSSLSYFPHFLGTTLFAAF